VDEEEEMQVITRRLLFKKKIKKKHTHTHTNLRQVIVGVLVCIGSCERVQLELGGELALFRQS
jgi:hypothetical protein